MLSITKFAGGNIFMPIDDKQKKSGSNLFNICKKRERTEGCSNDLSLLTLNWMESKRFYMDA